jgi:hypothetical protein
MKIPLPAENATLTRQELAQRWRCCIETIKRRQASGALKALKLGRLVRYRMEDVRAVEAEAEVQPWCAPSAE